MAKDHVDDALFGASLESRRFDDEIDSHATLISALQPLAPQLVVMEATGGYEAALACALHAAGMAVAAVNPRQARDFAKVLGRLAKTDRIDAEGLAEFGRMLLTRPNLARYLRPLETPVRQDLAALVTRRRQLATMLGVERQRLAIARPAVRGSVKALIKAIEKRLGEVDSDMTRHLTSHFRELDALPRPTGAIVRSPAPA